MIATLISLVARHTTSAGFATAGTLLASIGLSGIPSWVAIITAAGGLFGLAALRSTAALWRGERNAERVKADRLEGELRDEQTAHVKTLHKLEVAEAKPDVEKLYALMRAHDERMAAVSREIAAALAASSKETTAALQEVAANLAANTGALTLWATEQAQKM